MSKRTFQPNNRKRAKTHGFRLRMRTRAGRGMINSHAPRPGASLRLTDVLPRRHRLTSAHDFQRAIRGGRDVVRRNSLVAHMASTDTSEPPRVGFAVGKRVGDSVTRHRVVRRLRHVTAARVAGMPVGDAAGGARHPGRISRGLARPGVATSTTSCDDSGRRPMRDAAGSVVRVVGWPFRMLLIGVITGYRRFVSRLVGPR